MKNLKKIEKQLDECTRILEKTAPLIRDSELKSVRDNIKRVAFALRNINEIRLELYKVEPDLKPDFLNETLKYPEQNEIFALLVLESENLCKLGRYEDAINLYEEYVSSEPPEYFSKLASAEIKRIKTIYL
ncbi:MAG: hypothetical protein GTO02_05005 [Candidatus Dadabacteria bacterium]|nr:hypothetical protein [Candidatus Dadabacteria bacterium]NIQ13769.1 hypothetical protein [Candidatus Dadabacteria bacterium]